MRARPNGGVTYKGPNVQWSGKPAPRSPQCSTHVCIHWTVQGADAPPLVGAAGDGIPDQVDETLAAADASWQTIVGRLGFRAPLADTRSRFDGGNRKLDVYLADVGARKLAGYTASDDRRLSKDSKYKYLDISAFLVVDNDFAGSQFTRGTPLGNLRATVAHELFHASQFAYDYKEDRWLAEGTAAWIEDEVFDGVNLNRGYLKHSPLTNPLESLDYGNRGHEYGSWIFLRYLSERYGKDIIRQIWRYADDSPTQLSAKRSQTYSMVAVRRVLASDKRDLSDVFAAFARDNMRPVRAYREGAAYPRPAAARFILDRHNSTTRWQGLPIDHLAAFDITFTPGEDVPLKGQLRIEVDGPDRKLHSEFRLAVRTAKGPVKDYAIKINPAGRGAIKVPFGRKQIVGVDLTMVNGNSAMKRCYQRATPFSCSGRGADGRTFRMTASLA